MKRIQELFHKLFNYLYCLIASRGNMIVVNGWLNIRYGKIEKRNLGDELNYYLLKELTGKYIVGYYDIPHIRKRPNVLFIGSLVEEFTTPDSIIWGSGAISGDMPLRHKPAKVCAVRGKLTRKYLLEQGVDCPEIYGDPALLLPLIYQRQVKKRYRIGLIPHISDLQNPIVRKMTEDKDIHLIRFQDYKDWHSIIDEICECEMIASSSLHGLILADAYQIPNVWVRISSNLIGGDFKFLDYFSGVNRDILKPMELDLSTTKDNLIRCVTGFCPIRFDANRLLQASPICIKKELICLN